MFSKILVVVCLATNVWLMSANVDTSTENLILHLKQPIDPIHEQIEAQSFPTRAAKAETLMNALKVATTKWHAPVYTALKAFHVEVESFWITNAMYVKNADSNVRAVLEALDFLASVENERSIPLLTTELGPVTAAPTANTWSVDKIGAPEVWPSCNGTGIRVGITDSGVRGSHEYLKDNYVGADENGWYDPISKTTEPTDTFGHGTISAGICCATKFTSIAPGVKWLACKACDESGCLISNMIKCAEFMTCPFNAKKETFKCKYAPKIVNNSYGDPPAKLTWFDNVIKTWNKTGIIPVFAIGNSGPDCSTGMYPANQPGVISVGATDSSDYVSSFSSRGPNTQTGLTGAIPLIVAPGANITSAGISNDTVFVITSGTSMACPAVSGAVALLLCKKPELTLEDIEDYLFGGAVKILGISGGNCGTTIQGIYPNDVAGHGRLDVCESYLLMELVKGKTSNSK